MDWTPQIAFIILAVATVVAERRYFVGLEDAGGAVTSDKDFGADLRANPARLIPIVASETALRLRALAATQSDPGLERRRLIALLCIGLVLVSFVWSVVRALS
jgi:hypothetical protein